MGAVREVAARRDLAVITVGWQNVTSATPKSKTGVMMACEVDPATFRRAYTAQHWRVVIPKGDPRQAIAFDTRIWRLVGGLISEKIHKSAPADPEIPDYVHTPSRWVHRVRLQHRETTAIVSFIWTWWINSWKKAGGATDYQTPARRRLAKLARKATLQTVDEALVDGDEVVLAGDFNSLPARLHFFIKAGLRSIHGRGLDRMYRSRGLRVKRKGHLPKVGNGPTMYHEGLTATLELRGPAVFVDSTPPDHPDPKPAHDTEETAA